MGSFMEWRLMSRRFYSYFPRRQGGRVQDSTGNKKQDGSLSSELMLDADERRKREAVLACIILKEKFCCFFVLFVSFSKFRYLILKL